MPSERERFRTGPTQQVGEPTTVLGFTHEIPGDLYSPLVISEEMPYTGENLGAFRQQTMPAEEAYVGDTDGQWLTPGEQAELQRKMQEEAEREIMAEMEGSGFEGFGETQLPVVDQSRQLKVSYKGPDAKFDIDVETYGPDPRIRRILEAAGGDSQEDRWFETADRAEAAAYAVPYGHLAYPPAPQHYPASIEASSQVDSTSVVETALEGQGHATVLELARKYKKATRFIIAAACVAGFLPLLDVSFEAGKQAINGEFINLDEAQRAARGLDVPRGEDW